MTAFDLDRIGAGLPFADALEALEGALRTHRAVVVAPPGTGKTTLVPPAVANLRTARVVVTQPRRIAARAAARRLQSLTGTRPGELVGHTVRGESTVTSSTRIEFCTPGVLLRRLLTDNLLEGIDAVIVDEIHERQLDIDLVFALTREVLEVRDDFDLIAMSATLAADRFAELLGDPGTPAPRVEATAVTHPLTVEWAPPPGSPQDARGVTPAYLDHVAAVTRRALERHREGDALVFLPGVREVDQVTRRLEDAGVPDVRRLHGGLSARDQDAVLRSGSERRVIVSTALTESALTVPGVRLVIDGGLAREPRLDSTRGMSGLVTVAVSRAAATQRAGRAARLGPGAVVRCYAEDTWARLAAQPRPEILTGDLTDAMLTLACWGAPRGAGLALPDVPPQAAADRAEAELRELGAIDDRGQATDLGRRLARVPTSARLARALLDGHERWGAGAAQAVAVLASDERAPGGDLTALARDLGRSRTPTGARYADDVSRFEKILGERGGRLTDEILAGVAAYAHPGWIARRRGESDTYLVAAGTAVDLPSDSPLSGAPWLAVTEIQRRGTGGVIRAAAPLAEDEAYAIGAPMLVTRETAEWADGRATARRERALGAIVLSQTPIPATEELSAQALAAALQRDGLGILPWSEGAVALRRRLGVLHHALGDPWPAVDDAALAARVEEWLAPELPRLARGGGADLAGALRRLLPWQVASRLDELAPTHIVVPTGTRVALAYPEHPDQPVTAAVKLQECFGMTTSPRIADGRIPVVFHLLSPARRPLAVTADLASFWANAYAGVRAENRGRYSKHPWPEDPLTAPAQRGTKASGR